MLGCCIDLLLGVAGAGAVAVLPTIPRERTNETDCRQEGR